MVFSWHVFVFRHEFLFTCCTVCAQDVLKSTEITMRKRKLVNIAMDDVDADALTRALQCPLWDGAGNDAAVRALDSEYLALAAAQLQQEHRLEAYADNRTTAARHGVAG